MKVLMVCLGNICRSPLAEGILQHKALERGVEMEVDSAGTSGYHEGELPDPRSMEVAKKHGIDLSNQRSRLFIAEDFDRFDRIFVMDTSNRRNVAALARNDYDLAKVELMLNVSHPEMDMSVPDPYYGGDSGFDNVYGLLDEACDRFLDSIS